MANNAQIPKEWLLKIERDIVYLKTRLEDVCARLPECEKRQAFSKIKANRQLIFLILASYIPLVIGLLFTIIGGVK